MDPGHAADGSTLAFQETEREDEKANAHDSQDDHAGDKCARHGVHLKHGRFQVGWNSTRRKTSSHFLPALAQFPKHCQLLCRSGRKQPNEMAHPAESC